MKNYVKIKANIYDEGRILLSKNKEVFEQHISNFSRESIRLTL